MLSNVAHPFFMVCSVLFERKFYIEDDFEWFKDERALDMSFCCED